MKLIVRKLFLSSLFLLPLEAAEVSLSGTIRSFLAPEIPAEIQQPLRGFIAISAGSSDSFAIQNDGSLIGWGSNSDDQLRPLISPPDAFIHVDSGGIAGQLHSAYTGFTVALASDHSFRSFGNFAPRLLSDGSPVRFTQLSAGGAHCLGLELAGTIRAWGENGNGQIDVPPGLTDVQSVSAGGRHSLALTSAGQVIAWGSNLENQTSVPASLPEISQVEAGGFHNIALASDGQLFCWGDNTYGQCSPPIFSSPIVSISAGTYHSLALLQNGTVAAWGANVYPDFFGGEWITNQSLVPENLADVNAISAGDQHSLALHSDGSMTQWGNHSTAPTRFANVSKIESGSVFAVIKEDSSLVMWGNDSHGQASPPPQVDKVLDVAVGSFSTAVVNSDQTVTVFGHSGLGLTDIPADLPPIKSVAAGSRHFLALDIDGRVHAWGDNLDGQISIPPDLGRVIQIEASLFTSFALLENGTVVGWGEDQEGNLAIPEDLTDVVSISTHFAGAHVLALLSNGRVVSWGQNFYGEATVPSDLSGVVKVSAGSVHSMALLEDGVVVAWGNNRYGKLYNLNQNSSAPVDIYADLGASLLFFESGNRPLDLDLSFVDGSPLLSFESRPGQTFEIYRSSTLSDLGGEPFLPDYPADTNGETTSFLDLQPLSAKGFYRVVVK